LQQKEDGARARQNGEVKKNTILERNVPKLCKERNKNEIVRENRRTWKILYEENGSIASQKSITSSNK
jgi:hypothetical protein